MLSDLSVLQDLRVILAHPVTALRLLCGGISFDVFTHSGASVDPSNRDYGDEDDSDVVCDNGAIFAQVNQTPSQIQAARIEPVMVIRPEDRVTSVLRRGVEIGDFSVAQDGSVEPVVPDRGEVNHTWVMVLAGEMLIAAGRDIEDPIVAALPRRIADLVRDLVEV